jgi:phosphonate transport system substrate-binding protein
MSSRRHVSIRYAYAGLLFLQLVVMFGFAAAAAPQYQPSFSGTAAPAETEYVFAVHPLHNPERLFAVYGPIADYLSAHIPGVRFRLEASRNYEEYEKKLFARAPHFALPNPYQTVRAMHHGYHVFGKMGEDQNFRGIILVRRDSGIQNVSDLKGKKVSYPAPTALAATMMPQYYMHTHGIDANKDIENLYVGSQESSIINVYLGNTAAGATWPTPWLKFQEQFPEKAKDLIVKWETGTLPNVGLVVRDDVPAELVEKVGKLLFTLQDSAEGRTLLSAIPLSRFEAANDETYKPVREFLQKFSNEVRPVDQ